MPKGLPHAICTACQRQIININDNNKGPRIDPCGTQHSISCQAELTPLNSTCCMRLLRFALNQFKQLLRKTHFLNFYNSMS